MLMNDEDRDVLNTMLRYGGSFVKSLAEAAYHADDDNFLRIKRAWPDYWDKYRGMLNIPPDTSFVSYATERAELEATIEKLNSARDEFFGKLLIVHYGSDTGLLSMSTDPGELLMVTWGTGNTSSPSEIPDVWLSDGEMFERYGEDHSWEDVKDFIRQFYNWKTHEIERPAA